MEHFFFCVSLTSLNIPESLTTLAGFGGCSGLTSVTIPDSVTQIGETAFHSCSGLSAVTFTGNAPTIASNAFGNVNATVYYSRTDATWTASMRQNYGGTLVWSASCLGNHTPVADAAVAPTCTQPGKTEGSHCIYCNEVLVAQKEIPAKGHTPETVAGKNATCTETGLTEGSKCAVCGTVLTQQKVIPAKGHTPETVAGKEATCTETGLTEGSKCAVCGTVLTQQKEIPAKGHTPETVAGKEATCTESGLTEGSKCAVCGTVLTQQKEIPTKGHTPETVAGKEATCTEDGLTDGSKCAACGTVLTEQKVIPAAGHQWNEDWISDEAGHWHACTVCGAKKDENAHVSAGAATEDTAETCAVCGYTIAPPLGHIHTNHLTFVEAKAAACTEPGSKAYYVCSCGMWFADEAAQTEITDHSDVVLLPLGHTPEAVAGKEATCTESGLTEGSKCAVCGTVLTEQKEIPAKGHTPEIVAGKDATCTEPGLTEGSKCTVCGTVLTEQKTIAALGHSFTKYTYNNDAKAGVDGTETAKCDRCGAADTRTAVGTALPKIPFTDIAPGAYYEKAVAWAVENEITNGTTATTFSPNNACNRGQIVVFLWRMAGKPIAQNRNNPFTDVKEGSFCYEAVLWAAEQGITTGKTATTFCPAETCNRGQIVTFLWRYAGKPAPKNQNRQFTDVAANSFCDQAVMWAVENGITLGVDATHFNPRGDCTRGHAVTFLYRGRELLKK